MSEWATQRAFVVVRTYPIPAYKGAEVSCTAALTPDRRWLRLFPVPARLLDYDKRFSKYQWIDVSVRRAPHDEREESHQIDPDSIRIVETLGPQKGGWAKRDALLDPVRSHCLCCLKRTQAKGGPTLGLIRPPRINQLVIRSEAEPNWTADELARLQQMPLWGNAPAVQLEKVPYKFLYRFSCDHEDCRGHELSCTDWELGMLYRRCAGDSGWEAKFRNGIDRITVGRDLQFFVGTLHKYPENWIIVGLYYPPLPSLEGQPQLPL